MPIVTITDPLTGAPFAIQTRGLRAENTATGAQMITRTFAAFGITVAAWVAWNYIRKYWIEDTHD